MIKSVLFCFENHVRQGDGEGRNGYRGKCDTPLLKFIKHFQYFMNGSMIADCKLFFNMQIRMHHAESNISSKTRSKSVDKAIHRAMYYVVKASERK